MHYAKKRLGQHFLKDSRVIQRIIDTFKPQNGQHIVEIGPGKGAITQGLLPCCDQLDVIEYDKDIVAILEKNYQNHRLPTIHHANALKLNFQTLCQNPTDKLRIIGNLPYNISTPLIFHLLTFSSAIEDMLFMLQDEVVMRMAAQASDVHYGRLSIMTQVKCTVTPLFTIPPEAFSPRPKVISRMVALQPHRQPQYSIDDHELFAEIVRAAFNHRRKTLHNSLKPYLASQQLTALNIDPNIRPEQLTIPQFVNIANAVSSKGL